MDLRNRSIYCQLIQYGFELQDATIWLSFRRASLVWENAL